MTKATLAEQISFATSFNQKVSMALLDDVIEIIKSTLENQEDVKLTGFGTVQVKRKDETR